MPSLPGCILIIPWIHITLLAECGPENENILDRMLVLELVYVGKQELEVASTCSSNFSLIHV
jgi:hypothetical protein